MLLSIPAKYLDEIQDKMDLDLLINYRSIFYEPCKSNLEELNRLLEKNMKGEKIFFSELAAVDDTYLQVVDDIKKYAEGDFLTLFEKVSKESDISKLFTKKMHSWGIQRKRWSENKKVREKAKSFFEITNKNFTREEWERKYNCYTVDEYLARMEKEIAAWNKNREYFYKFPYFDHLTDTQKKNGLKIDICRNLFELFQQDQVFDEYYISKTDYLLDKPIFTEKKYKLAMEKQEDDGNMKAIVDNGDDIKITYMPIPKEKNIEDSIDIMKTLDPDDSRLIDYIMTHTGSNLYTNALSTYTLSELAKKVLGWHGSSGLENVKKRLLNLVRPIYYNDGETEMNVTLFDSCVITKGKTDANSNVEQQIVTVVPGFAIREAYIKNQLTYIAKNQYEKLEQPFSKHICYNLQRDRVGLASYNQPLQKKYELKDFSRIVQFETNDRKHKFNTIRKSLDEFVQKKFIVEKYDIETGGFFVYFYPLSDAEKRDLEHIRKIKENRIIEEQNK